MLDGIFTMFLSINLVFLPLNSIDLHGRIVDVVGINFVLVFCDVSNIMLFYGSSVIKTNSY